MYLMSYPCIVLRLVVSQFQVLLMVEVFILSWEYEWIINALQEFVMFLILAHLGVTFAPLDPWLLTRAFDHSLEQGDSVAATT